MNRWLAVWLCVLGGLLAISFLGCGPVYDGPQRARVSGIVTFNGTQVAIGILNLMPDGHDGRMVSVPITNGAYLIEETDGPNFGKYKVEILGFEAGGERTGESSDQAAKGGEKQIIPGKYNKNTKLQLDVNQPAIKRDFALSS